MSFRKLLERKLLSTVLATTLAISTVLTSAAPALAVEGEPSEQLVTNLDESAAPVEMSDGTATPEVVGEPIAQPAVEPIAQPAVEPIAQPAVEPVAQENGQEDAAPVLLAQPDAAAPAVERDGTQPEGTTPSESTGTVTPQAPMLRAPAAVTATGTSLTEDYDPSDLSNWVVYDHYYNAAWPKTGPSNWDVNANGGYHPFFYWKEGEIYKNNKFYDLSTAADKARIQTEVFAPSAPRELNTPCVAYFSQHIYTEGSKNNATITFLGYGETFKTDWAIAPVTTTELKSIAFDIDASKVNPHTLDGFGIIVNAGIDRSNDTLKGYVLNFKMANNSQGTTNGVVQLIDISRGTNASKLHDGLNGYQRLADPNVGTATSLGTFDLKNSPIGKIRVDLDIEPTKLGVKLSYYPSTTGAATQAASYNVNLTDTKFAGFGPIVNYNGDGHICARLSSVTFGSTVISVPNYAVIFDGNGATVQANPDRVNNVPKGKSMKDMGYAMPTPPQRTGYVFIGWNTAQDGTGTAFDDTFVVNQITTVYAQWSLDQLAVTYAAGANGSLQGSATETVNYGDHPKAVPTPVPNAGYQFSHWEDGSGKTYANAAAIEAVTIQGPMTFTAIFDRIPNATVTYKAGANGSLQGNATETVQIGGHPAQVPTPVPAAGFSFSHWEDDQGQTYANAAAIQAVTINGDMTFTAVFDQIPAQTVTYKAGANGSLQGNATEQVAWGGHPAQVPTPVPAAGFSFSHWEDDQGQTYANAAAIQAVTVTGPITFTAVFDQIPAQTVTYKAGANGSLQGNATEQVAWGGHPAQVPTPVPAAGFSFSHWEDDQGQTYANAAAIQAVTVTGPITFTAVFDQIPAQTVTYKAGANGSLQGNATEQVAWGGHPAQVPTPVPAATYQFSHWEDDQGQTYANAAAIQAVTVTGPITFTAIFDKIPDYTVNYVAGPNGTLNGASSEKVAPGGTLANTPTPVPAKYYEFVYWEDNDKNQYTAAQLALLQISGDVTFTAVFAKQQPLCITYVAGPNGTLQGNANENVMPGDSPVNVPTPVANKYYEFKYWEDQNGVKYPTKADVEKIVVSEALTLTANFDELSPYKIDYVAGPNGSLTGPTTENVKPGDNIANPPTTVPATNYEFQYWQDQDGNKYLTDADLMKAPITGDMIITAIFDLASYKIIYCAGPNGTIGTPNNEVVKYGGHPASVPTTTPNAGYVFEGWKDQNGTVYPTNADVEKITVSSDLTLTAVFELNQHTVTFVAGAGGSIAGTTTQKVRTGASVTSVPTPTANQGFTFQYWEDDNGNQYKNANQVMRVKIADDITFTAVFDTTKIKVKYVAGNNGTLNGTDLFPSVPVGGKLTQYAPAPTPVPDQYYMFDHWEDVNGAVIDPATAVAGDNTTKIKAKFEKDENGDNIPDKDQQKIKVNLEPKGPGRFAPTDITKYTVVLNKNGEGFLGKTAGFVEPQLIPDKTVDPTVKFFWWEDAQMNKIVNLKTQVLKTNCTLYALFDTDKNGNDIPDSREPKIYTVTFKVKGGGGKLQGTTVFKVEAKPNGNAVLRNAIGGYIEPRPVGNKGMAFYRWEDINGNEVTNTNQFKVSGDAVIYARFGEDTNGDGIADIGQNKYIITFIAGPGGSLQGNPTYTLIGGRKGDNRPLFLMDVVGQFIQPTPVANSGYTFTGWNPQFSATYPITGDTVFVANFKKVKDGGGCRVKFRCNNKDWKDFDCNKGSKVKDGCGNSIPTPSCPSGYKFVGWQGSDGKIYTNVQVLQITVTIDITFTAVFTRVG